MGNVTPSFLFSGSKEIMRRVRFEDLEKLEDAVDEPVRMCSDVWARLPSNMNTEAAESVRSVTEYVTLLW